MKISTTFALNCVINWPNAAVGSDTLKTRANYYNTPRDSFSIIYSCPTIRTSSSFLSLFSIAYNSIIKNNPPFSFKVKTLANLNC